MAGNLQIAASWGLGGLGATEGPPVTCNWTTAGLVPQLLPWLAILVLLALKPNLGWSAWWIWLPLAGLVAGWHCLELALQSSDTGSLQGMLVVFLNVPVALAFGVAALWLLAPCLGRGHRFRTFLGILAVLVVFIVFSFAARAGWGLGVEPIASLLDPRHCAATAHAGVMGLPFLVPLTMPAPGLAAALVLCGLACRGRYRPFGLYLWLFLSLLVVWVGVPVLLQVLCRVASPGSVEYALFIGSGPLMVAVTYATLLPFLILSSASPFFRERLKALLQVKPEERPAMGVAASLGAVAQYEQIRD
jgi:hypothetical protein